MTINDFKEVVDIVDKVIDATPHLKGQVCVIPQDFSYFNGTGKLIFWSEDKITNGNSTEFKLNAKDKFKPYFEGIAKSRNLDYGQFYHILKFDYALSTLTNKEIQLSALNYLWDNDPLEHTEFLRRHGYFKNLVYDKIEEIKNKDFIFCFSDSFRNEDPWKLYGQNETGVALGFRFTKYSDNPAHTDLYQLKDIAYEGGYDFDFINEIQFRLKRDSESHCILVVFRHFQKIYKRAKYK